LDRRVDGPQSWFGCGGKEKTPCLFQELNPHLSACSLVTILTELPLLLAVVYFKRTKISFKILIT
jgi:hypothetical protein